MLPPASASRSLMIRYWITRTFSGRAMAAGALVKLVAYLLGVLAGRSTAIEIVDTCGDLALVAGAVVLLVRLFTDVKQALLWRVRRKLTLSYIFIGFVPALLIIVFFLVSGLLLFFNIAAYMMRGRIDALVDQARFVAESTVPGLQRARGAEDVRNVLAAREAALAMRYPGASVALVPAAMACGSGTFAAPLPSAVLPVGPWAHLPAPASMPAWITCDGHAGLIAYGQGADTRLAARAGVWVPGAPHAIVVDIPLDAVFAAELRDDSGIVLGEVVALDSIGNPDADPDADPDPDPDADVRLKIGPANVLVGGEDQGALQWVTLVDYMDWDAGSTATLVLGFGMSPRAIYNRISLDASVQRVEGRDFGQILLLVLAIVGVLFLIIQAVAFSMGLALARSITGSVHELFAGTERVRRGDFTGRIAIRSRDQLGELAESFNSMTASIEDLLQQKAEKERMEQELRIARSIQMSLLPQGPLTMPGVSVIAHCEPAREVGGDYYDFLPIDDGTLGILIADVSGKGTSAALYMAELKGIVLSLSQRHTSPRDLLIEADHIISRHLDSRSFITVTYILLDLRAGLLRYARAGHCPMIYVPGPYAPSRLPRLIAPDGLVLGLQLDAGETFTRLLEEVTVPIGPGDLFLLYTDGISEAMNTAGDCFGDARLAELVAGHADLPADELRERILREIAAFAGTAAQHDDMTMVLLRVEEVGGLVPAAV